MPREPKSLYSAAASHLTREQAKALADRTLWTADLLLRAEPLRGKVAALQTTPGGFTAHVGGGAGRHGPHHRGPAYRGAGEWTGCPSVRP